MYEDPKSKISQLEKVLNSMQDNVSGKTRRHELHKRDITVKQNWDDNESIVGSEISGAPMEDQLLNSSPEKSDTSLPVKILIGSIIFFVVVLGAAAFKFLSGGNLVSGNNIEVTVKAPISVTGGEVMSFEVEVKNNNNVSLLGTDMGIAFPSGSKDGVNSTLPAKRAQDFLGDILPGQSVKKNLAVALFGVQDEKKVISITLEYKVAGSNSLFNKTKEFTVLIGSSPVSIVVTGPTEVNTNQTVSFTTEITSNSPTIIKNLLLKVSYPPGFSFGISNPSTYSQNNTWLIGDLSPGDKRTIKFSGFLNGQEGEERGFNFNLGSQSSADNLIIDVPFTSSFSSVTIRRPFVSADLFLDGEDTPEHVSRAGSGINGIIKWQNNLPYEVSDISIAVKIVGNDVNKSSFQVDGGFYQSANNTIIFDKTTNPIFASLQPGQVGESEFNFSSFDLGSITGAGLINPVISLDVSVSGQRVGYQAGQTDILFTDSRKIKITADPQIFAKALYYVGPFKNSGPIPPKAETETTYTITWTVTNPLNNISGAVVSATLPPYVKWLSNIIPAQEKLNYNEGTGLVTWNVGSVQAGAGIVSPAREVSFHISLLPSVTQIGTGPNLIGNTTLNAKDSFTLTPVSNSYSSLDTRLNSDPYFKAETEKVVQ
jgi:hypothetical protein